MNLKRQLIQTLCVAAIGLAAAPGLVFAQSDYPNRPIKLVVPFPPGGTSDVMGRLMADELGKRSDLTVVKIAEFSQDNCSVDGKQLSLNQWCASLHVYITAKTNTDQEISRFIGTANEYFSSACFILHTIQLLFKKFKRNHPNKVCRMISTY